MTMEELRWLHRIEARIEIEGLDAGQRIIKGLARFNRFTEGHQQMVARDASAISGVEHRQQREEKAQRSWDGKKRCLEAELDFPTASMPDGRGGLIRAAPMVSCAQVLAGFPAG